MILTYVLWPTGLASVNPGEPNLCKNQRRIHAPANTSRSVPTVREGGTLHLPAEPDAERPDARAFPSFPSFPLCQGEGMILLLLHFSSSRNRLRFGRSYGMLDTVWGGGGMVDTEDLKSFGRKPVRVRLPPALPKQSQRSQCDWKQSFAMWQNSASSHTVIVPLSPDLFSLQGLRNLGPTLRRWREGWTERLGKNPVPQLELPTGRTQPAGYIVQQHSVRMDRPVKAYERWIA